MNDTFQPRAVSYNLRSQTDFTRPKVNSDRFGINSLGFMAEKVWGMVPNEMKNINELSRTILENGNQEAVTASYV